MEGELGFPDLATDFAGVKQGISPDSRDGQPGALELHLAFLGTCA